MKTLKKPLPQPKTDSPLLKDFIDSLNKIIGKGGYNYCKDELGISWNTIKSLKTVSCLEDFYKKSPRVVATIISRANSIEISQVLQKHESEFSLFRLKNITSSLYDVNDELKNLDFKKSSNPNTLNRIQECLTDPTTLKIYYLSKRKGGVSQTELIRMFGESHKFHIDQLIYNEMLLSKNETFYADPAKFIQFERSHIKKMIPVLNCNYKTEHSGQSRNFIYFRQHSVTRETQIELIRLHEKFLSEMNKILDNPDCIGDIPFYGFGQAGELF